MLSTIYSALSGMLGFSKGLDVISNNIANLNTPGYKGSELAFRDLFYRYSVEGGTPDGLRSPNSSPCTAPRAGAARSRFIPAPGSWNSARMECSWIR